MPFKNSRIFLIGIAIIVLIIIIALAASSSSPKPAQSGLLGKVYTATINADIGVQNVIVTNLNTNSHTLVMRTEFPFSFNATTNEVYTFNVTAQTGFTFDSWLANDGTFHSQNPYTIKISGPLMMHASFTPVENEP